MSQEVIATLIERRYPVIYQYLIYRQDYHSAISDGITQTCWSEYEQRYVQCR